MTPAEEALYDRCLIEGKYIDTKFSLHCGTEVYELDGKIVHYDFVLDPAYADETTCKFYVDQWKIIEEVLSKAAEAKKMPIPNKTDRR